MPRLFTGLEIPPAIALPLSFKRGGLPGARWIDPENYHITLSFVGDVPGGTAREVTHELGEAGRTGPVEINLDHLDAFGGDKPRALIARVQPSPALTMLKGEIDAALMRAGVRPEKRRFVPHVTLARLKGTTAPEVAHYLEDSADTVSLKFVAPRFVLFSSKPSLGGGPYGHEQTYGLDAFAGFDEADFDPDIEDFHAGLPVRSWS